MNRWNGKGNAFDCAWWTDTYTNLMINALNGSACTFKLNGQQAANALQRMGLVTTEPLTPGSKNVRVFLTAIGKEQATKLRDKEFRV